MHDIIKYIECSEILHRLVTASQIEQGKACNAAFFRKVRKDGAIDEGLSVDIKSIRPLEHSINPEKSLKGVKLVCSLHTGILRDLEDKISIQHLPTESNNGHAEILGLPDSNSSRYNPTADFRIINYGAV